MRLPTKGGKAMPVSKAQQKAQNKWIAKAYDRINLTVPKGKKETIQAHAEAQGQSVNAFINGAIDREMEKPSQRPVEALNLNDRAGVVSLPSETVEAAQRAAEAAGEGLPQFIGRAVTTQARRDELARKMEGTG